MSIGLALGIHLGNTKAVEAPVSVGALSPDAVSGLALWLKADSLSLNDGDPVSTWTDSSGNGHDFTGTGSNRPIYKTNIINSTKPVLRFASASTQYLVSSAIDLTAASGVTVFVVTTNITSGAQYFLLEHSVNAGTNNGGFYIVRLAGDNIEALTRGGGVNASAQSNVTATTRVSVTTLPRLVTAAINKSRSTEEVTNWVNGLYLGGLEGSATGRSADNDTGSAMGNFAFYLGARGGATNPLNGDIAEVLIYSRVVTSRERDRVSLWLNDKYDLFS